MPKPIKEDYNEEELVRIQLQFWGKVLKQVDRVAAERGITRTALFYIIIRDWLMYQGYDVSPADFSPPNMGPGAQ